MSDHEVNAPDADGHRTITRGEICPKCGEPGFRRTRTFGLLVEVIMVHSTFGGSGYAGCMIEERLRR